MWEDKNLPPPLPPPKKSGRGSGFILSPKEDNIPAWYDDFCLSVTPHVRESTTVWDSGFYDVDSGFQVLDSRFFLSVELGFWIGIVRGIPSSLSWITDSRKSGFQIPQAEISRIPKFGFPSMGRFAYLFSYFHKDTLDVCLRTTLNRTSMGKDNEYPSWTPYER